MTNFTSWAGFFTVKMNFGAWLGTERKRVHTENIFILAA